MQFFIALPCLTTLLLYSLILNYDKTKIMLIDTHQRLHLVNSISIKVKDTIVERVYYFIYIYIYTHRYIHIHTRTRTHTHIRVRIHIYMYIYIYKINIHRYAAYVITVLMAQSTKTSQMSVKLQRMILLQLKCHD